MRHYPCTCDQCMEHQYDTCENSKYVGKFTPARMGVKGRQVPKSRFTAESAEDGQEYAVQSIEGKCMKTG